MKTPRRCPCGSGRLRDACDPAELGLCAWGEGDAMCTALFHKRANAHKYCPTHQIEAHRKADRESAKRKYARRKREREAAAIAEAEERIARRAPSPEQTTLEL